MSPADAARPAAAGVSLHSALIGIGSNLGDRDANIGKGLHLLEADERVHIDGVSALIATAPVGGPPQGRFLNGVADLHTSRSPGLLLALLKDIERELGRTPTVRDGPRTLDLDILLYDDCVIESPELTIPHARMLERAFVLEPAAEIAPARVHPRTGRTLLAHWVDLRLRPHGGGSAS